jgi:hypothetical protein
MAIWTEIVREAEAGDPWLQASRARGDLPLCVRRYLEATRDLRHWRDQVRSAIAILRAAAVASPAGILGLSVAWTHYRDAQRRRRVWRRATADNADYAALLTGTVAVPLERLFASLAEGRRAGSAPPSAGGAASDWTATG